MGKTLNEIAQTLRDSDKKVQMIYAFNGVGKTRLSREFKELVAPKNADEEQEENERVKILYYNAFTEDLFYWQNEEERKLRIFPNDFTRWILETQGKENDIITLFQHYTNDKLTPRFNDAYNEITFSIESGNNDNIDNIKISKGEESCLIWCVFYSLLEQVVEVLNIAEPEDRETDQFNKLQYVFIDDPVSSLDENHLIELAVNLGGLIKKANGLKFIVSTHNPLFYNVLYNELELKKKNKTGKECCYMLSRDDDGMYNLNAKLGDSNTCFSYHLYLKQVIQEAIDNNNIQKYHFMLLRNLYEKTANFLGYQEWSELLPDDKQAYYNRIVQFTSHSTLSNEAVPEPTDPEKQTLKKLFKHLIENRYYTKQQDDTV